MKERKERRVRKNETYAWRVGVKEEEKEGMKRQKI